ncbi:hypothetical protein BH11ARM1_BH11ARM1_01680 [soil metagenome]
MVSHMKFLQKRKESLSRKRRLESIKELGFELVDERGWRDGAYWPKRYILVSSDGLRFNNEDNGYSSTSSALEAAKSLARNLNDRSNAN